jgi:hypothetical protein
LLVAGCQHGGEGLYPLGIYGVRTISDQQAVRQAGFNLVAGPANKPYLDSAHRLGLKVLATPGTWAGPGFSPDRARAVVSQFDRHPALWAWYLVDEPDLNAVAPAQVEFAHRFLKRLGAAKPTALVLYQGGEALAYGNIADLTMIDRYPIPWLPLANFPQHVRLVRLALGKDKPLIAVIQAFDWSYFPDLLPGKTNLRPPTEDEIRCMTYCALARRANGLFYYCFDDGKWDMRAHPVVWEALRTVVAEVKERQPLFQAEHVWWHYVHEFSDPASGFNAALESSVTPALLRVARGNKWVPAGTYLLAVNNTDRSLRYRITMPPLRNEHVLVFDENRTLPLVENWLEDDFAPYAVHIYGPLR